MSVIEKINQCEWDGLFNRLIAQTDERIAAQKIHIALLLKHEGDPNHIPHDCIENLRNLTCGICGAHYERER